MRIFPFVRNYYSLNESKIVILSIPYEGYVNSRLGSFMAPEFIRKYSECVEIYSNYFNDSLENSKFFDLGDIKVNLKYDNDNTILEIYNYLKSVVIDRNKKYVFVGGDHSITIAAFWAVKNLYKNLTYIHLDAHADCHDIYLKQKYSHANVLRRISEENNTISIGVRTLDDKEKGYFFSNIINIDIDKISFLDDYIKSYVYLSVDVDFFDPSICKAVSNPVSNGGFITDYIKILQNISPGRIVGFDLVEVNPALDYPSFSTSIFASELIREFIIYSK